MSLTVKREKTKYLGDQNVSIIIQRQYKLSRSLLNHSALLIKALKGDCSILVAINASLFFRFA